MTGNIKALTNDELKFVVSRYEFQSVDNYVIVHCNNKNTIHDKSTAFSLLLPLERRRIKITTRAIDLWDKKYLNKYSLVEVQNAINTLIVTYQNPNEENIDGQLKRTRAKLDNLFKGE